MAAKKPEDKLEKRWKAFEKSGSIVDFMKYHTLKQPVASKGTPQRRAKKKIT